jgi:predicted RNA-binding protein with PIN domain
MLHLIIDGYNLIRQVPSLESKDKQSLEAGRNALIDALKRYQKIKPHRMTIVFDGASTLSDFAPAFRDGGINVCFSPANRSADDVIKDMAKDAKSRGIVVSSDNSVIKEAKYSGCAVIPSKDFWDKLKFANLTEQDEMTKKDEEKSGPKHKRWSTYKKGPSKKLPKKQRQNKSKLDKL